MKKRQLVITLAVLSVSFSCEDILGVEDISKEQINILAPTNNAILNDTDITFSWDALEDADAYHLQIAKPSFQEALQIVEDTLVTNTSFNTSLGASTYQWRIRAENSVYQTPYTINNLTIE